MSEITLTPAMRDNLLSLKATVRLMDTTQTRIATGRKINSALDGPLPYFTALGLTNKAGDLAVLKDAMGQGISTIKAADQALTSITDLVEQMRGLAASAKEGSVSERKDLAAQFDVLRTQVDKLAADATYSGRTLVAGRGAITGGIWADVVTAMDALAEISGTSITGAQVADNSFSMSIEGQYSGTTALATGGNVASGSAGTLTVTLGTSAGGASVGWSNISTNVTMTVSADTNTLTVTDGVNSVDVATNTIDASGESVNLVLGTMSVTLAVTVGALTYVAAAADTANKTDSNERQIKMTAFGETTTLAADTGSLSFTNSNWGGNGVDLTVGTEASLVVGNTAIATRTNSGGTGANDMKVFFNEDSSAFVNTEAVDATSLGLSVGAAQGEWATDANVDVATTALTAAIDSLRSNVQALATNIAIIQTREDFTEKFVNILLAGGDKLTLADTNEEAANMLALQTRQQLGIESLSMASQSAQSVLSLFR